MNERLKNIIIRTVFIGISATIVLWAFFPILRSGESSGADVAGSVNSLPLSDSFAVKTVVDTVYVYLPPQEQPVAHVVKSETPVAQPVTQKYNLYQISAWYLKSYEGLFLYPYKCSGGAWTIGWGHVITSSEFGTHVTGGKSKAQLEQLWRKTSGPHMSRVRQMRNLVGGNTIDRDMANDMFVRKFNEIRSRASEYTDEPHQEFALAMFAYNVGWSKITSSDTQAGRALRSKDWDTLADVMNKYVNAGGRRMDGLVKRRNLESRILLGDLPSTEEIEAARNKVISDIQQS